MSYYHCSKCSIVIVVKMSYCHTTMWQDVIVIYYNTYVIMSWQSVIWCDKLSYTYTFQSVVWRSLLFRHGEWQAESLLLDDIDSIHVVSYSSCKWVVRICEYICVSSKKHEWLCEHVAIALIYTPKTLETWRGPVKWNDFPF